VNKTRMLSRALALSVKGQLLNLFYVFAYPGIKLRVENVIFKNRPANKWICQPWIMQKAPDGAILSGSAPLNAYAKYTLPKGLPKEGRVLAIENEPHTVDDFDGEITEGYGKGKKHLLLSDTCIVKVAGRVFESRINYHLHEADKAGPHYDIVAEGVPSGIKQWELHIPRGQWKGRYAFVTTDKGMIVTTMKDRGLIIPKPKYQLKEEEFLETLDQRDVQRRDFIEEHKIDGSLGNAYIDENHRVAIRSHREGGQTYYDRLPQLEFIRNESPFGIYRLVVRDPKLGNTVLTGELYHPDGPARVAGILNALPDKARSIQQIRGPVSFHAWDIHKYKGKDVSKLPYVERRQLYIKGHQQHQAIQQVLQLRGGEQWPRNIHRILPENYSTAPPVGRRCRP
jgi:hypothetical protein